MADGWGPTALNSALTSLGSTYPYVQLHTTGGPGAAGTSHVAGNTVRQSASYGTASGGSIATNAALTWTSVSTSETYTDFTTWTASSAGTFGDSGSVTANPVTAGDTFTIPSGSLTHAGVLAS